VAYLGELDASEHRGWGRLALHLDGKAAKQYKGANELRLKPQWKFGGDLSQLKGRTVRLRFTLRNARLYSFGFI
jgi:hypothetical protein